MTSFTSPTRRVLGDRDPNALLHTQSARKTAKGVEATSPAPPRSTLKRPLSPFSPRAGRKRKVEEMNDEGAVDSQITTASLQPLSQMTDIFGEEAASGREETSTASMAQTKSAPQTAATSFSASQDYAQSDDAEFEIHDEPSQQTLDKMHAVTLPQNTSQLVPPLRPNLVKEPSQASLSMSSFIDFEDNVSAQSDNMQLIEEVEVVDGGRPKTQEAIRKDTLLEKAETLRTRLQLALFKVQTNQISQPFARLQVPRTRSASPQVPVLSSSPASSSTWRVGAVQRTDVPLETRVAIARARATMGPKPSVRPLSSLPTPAILPTAFSARWNDELEADQASHGGRPDPSDIPSSPPLSEDDDNDALCVNPMRHRTNFEPRTPAQMSSPGGSHYEGKTDRRTDLQYRRLRPGGLTSSVIKGEAANSLLELVRGGVARPGGVGMCGL